MKTLLVISVCIALLSSFAIAQQAPTSFACNIANCQLCSFPNFCGLCNNNFMLQINNSTSVPYCQAVTCNIANCTTCYQNNVCSVCNANYAVTVNGTCTFNTIPTTCGVGCLNCNSTACLLCNFGYNLLNGACFSNNGNATANCMSGFTPYACQFCNPGYVVNSAYQCSSNPGFTCNSITNCAACSQSGQTITCSQCLPDFQLNSNNTCTALTCNVQNCMACSSTNSSACSQCLPLYLLNTSSNQCQLIVYQCNIANCVYCSAANICSQCTAGYIPVPNNQGNFNNLGSSCVLLTSSVGGAIPVTNCLVYGNIFPGASTLEVGCVTCNQYFVNVGGYCVANISLGNYTCTIENCVYCVQNNICGQCAPGYSVVLANAGVCVPNYSPIPNCLVTPLFTGACTQCASGYALVGFTACVPLPNPPVTCNISGCNYCTTNDTCQVCMTGYNLVNSTTCAPQCNISNCYQCSSTTTCQACAYGFYLNTTSQLCLNASNQSSTFCSSTFGVNCTQCSYYQCTQCATGYTINTNIGGCCPTPNYNYANCSQYSTQWGSGCSVTITCTLCNPGALFLQPFVSSPQVCASLPCLIANCSYCFRSNVCSVCNPGFNLNNNNVCVPYTVNTSCPTNCVQCNSSNQCTSCLSGYILYNGNCVCNFQNCLACQGSSYCTLCAFPTIATITSSGGCLPLITLGTYCNIQNCLYCSSSGVCGQCSEGFTLLASGVCQQNVCNRINNCSLCNYNQNLCFACNQGYLPSTFMSASCVSVQTNYSCSVPGCMVCASNNPTACQVCSPFTSLTSNKQCDPINCITNCIYCLSSNQCIICAAGFYLTNANTCVQFPANASAVACPSTIPNCVGCQIVNSVPVCIQCTLGLQPAANQLSCVPQTCTVPNCQICLQNQQFNNGLQLCLICQQGYSLNSYFQCLPVTLITSPPNCSNIYNCIFCSENNYCGYCAPSWNATNGLCLTNVTAFCTPIPNCLGCTQPNVCGACAPSYQLNTASNVCIPLCNISNCQTCANLTTCGACYNNFVLANNTCSCPDTTFNIANNTCVCPSGTTQSNGTCVPCNVTNCLTCTSSNYCGTCLNNLVLTTCGCNATFAIVNGICTCPSGTTLSSGTCVGCNVTNCLTCSSLNVCSACMSNLILTNNTCGCADNTFTIIAGTCLCPSGTTLSNGTCVACNVANCQTCSTTNVCSNCTGNLTLTNNTCGCPNSFAILGGLCLCPAGTTLSNGTCVICSSANCLTCSSYNQCSQCQNNLQFTTCGCLDSTYQFINNICSCPVGTTLYGGTCVSCNVNNCQNCSSLNICQACQGNLTLNSTSNTCGCPNTFTLSGITCVCAANTTLFNGTCVPCNVTNCLTCNTANTCQNCTGNVTLFSSTNCSCSDPSFIIVNGICVCPVNTTLLNGVCISCTVANCAFCSAANTCQNCTGNVSLISSTNCSCTDPSFTIVNGNCVCPVNTSLAGGVCVPCQISNCLTCSASNTCSACVNNLTLIDSSTCGCTSNLTVVNSFCVCPALNTLVNGTCISCSIQNCLACSSAGICQTCVGNLTLDNSTNTCGCAPGLIISNNYCVCQSGSSLVNGTCVSCNPTNCAYCSSANICQQCVATTVFTACGCPGVNQTLLSNNTCGCVSGTTLYNGNCVACSVTNCLTCNSTNVCQNCTGNLTLNANNTCSCPDATFSVIGGNCVCASGFSLSGTTCISCSPTNCAICSSVNVCQTCVGNLTVNLTSNTCGCPNTFTLTNGLCVCAAGTTLFNGSCVTCNVNNCLTCSNTNVCQTCQNNLNLLGSPCLCNDYTFIIVNSTCVCPANTTLATSGSTCTPCNVSNCQFCSSSNVCQNCTGNLTLTNNTCNCPDTTFNISGGNCVCPVNTTILTTGSAPTCVACNVTNCLTCATANTCQNCFSNLVLTNNTCGCGTNQTLGNQTCYNCNVTYCSACSANNFCSQCFTNFTSTLTGSCVCSPAFTFYNDSCVSCNVNNCILCQTSNVCTTCATNYYALSSTFCVLCSINNCLTCSSSNYCTSCANGLQVNSQGNLCVSCGIKNCTLCLNSYTCSACNTGYQLSSTLGSCFPCNISGCAVCSNSTTCQTCLRGYSNVNGACSLCIYPCATCNGTSLSSCLTCAMPYSISPASNGTCYTCTVPNCANCSSTNTNNCSVCINNYSPSSNGNGTCVYTGACSPTCTSCSFNQVCQSCIAGYTVSPINNTQCIQCSVTNCITCSPTDVTTCFVCSPGYYVVGGLCTICPYANCQTCTSTACLTYFPSTNQMGLTVNNTVYQVICDPGCNTCSTVNPIQCITCSPGFSLNANLFCTPCTYPCLTCNASTPTVCLSCYGNLVLNGTSCNTCGPNCLTCTSASQCTSCQNGYILSNGNCNTNCSSNNTCQSCLNSTFCSVCISGFSANPQGQCLPCLSNCRVCSGNAQAVCLRCGLGFYLNQNTSTCMSCPSNCYFCNMQGCLSCAHGYSLSTNMTCLANCQPPCATCSSTNPSSCITCLFGYNNQSNTCVPQTSCTNGICVNCPIGSIPSNTSIGTCTQCTGSNCARCSSANPSTCITCLNGNYLSSNSACVSCPSQCATCTSPSNCLTCASGYTLSNLPVASPGVCVQCKGQCSQCMGNPYICTACNPGFSLNGWNCQSNFYFGFYVVLGTNLTVFYDNYQQFLIQLLNPTSTQNLQFVTLSSITYGTVNVTSGALGATQQAVNVTGSISTTTQPETNGAGNQFYALQNSLSSGSIAGMSIITSLVTYNGGGIPPPASQTNLALILGICIPLGIIIIGLLVYFIFIRKSNKESYPVDYKSNNTTVRETFELTAKGQPTL